MWFGDLLGGDLLDGDQLGNYWVATFGYWYLERLLERLLEPSPLDKKKREREWKS